MLDDLPVLGICGFSGSGKTTLIEQLIPHLQSMGLKVAVVKHDVHKIDVDRKGKDSDRIFLTGADVFLQSPHEEFSRVHVSDDIDIKSRLLSLSRLYDIILIEGRKMTPVTKVWLLSQNESSPPPGVEGIVATLPFNSDRMSVLLSLIENCLQTSE